ncbi:MAG: sigma-70 family RNA polymerase sigma factor [Sedimentisphaerales bacterium]|nr:sigma-70 family RNA polymerase sigma factor [Sedimentisphaerales bacterium]
MRNNDIENEVKDRAQSFMGLYIGVQRRLFGYVLSQVPNTTDADDIIQETVALMWAEFDKYKPGTNFAAWALCVARFQIMTYRKKSLRKKNVFSELAISAIHETVEAKANLEPERQKTLRECLSKLSKKDKQILYFRYEVGETLRSVSERFNLNANTLYSKLNRIHLGLLHCVRKNMEY